MARDNCWSCRRPQCVCLCDAIGTFASQVRFVILAHPREARSKISTGYLAHLSLKGSCYIEGYDFEHSRELHSILDEPCSESYLLFPSDQALPLASQKNHINSVATGTINIIVIESTWSQARTMLARSPKLRALKSVILDSARLSRFKIRTQPHDLYLSTIEAIAYTLNDLGEFSSDRTEEFLKPFLTMVDRQIVYQKQNSPRYRPRF